MTYKVFAFLSAFAFSVCLLVSPVLAAEVGTYPMVCDYKVETDSGDIVYIPSNLASDAFRTLIVNRTAASGGYTVVASNSASLWPLITIDEAGYYKSWLNWDANSNADTYIFTPATEQGQEVNIVVDSVSSTGTALGTDTAGDYVSWSNYNVLDNTGNLYHARNGDLSKDGFFLYNGVELPDINSVWTDKDNYPNAVLRESNSSYRLYLFSSQITADSNQEEYFIQGNYSLYKLVDGDWVFQSSSSDVTFLYEYSAQQVFWSNCDIIDIQNNSVILAASEPIPVGGVEPDPEPEPEPEPDPDPPVNVDVDLSEVVTLLNEQKDLLSEMSEAQKSLNTVLFSLLIAVVLFGAVGMFRSLIGR